MLRGYTDDQFQYASLSDIIDPSTISKLSTQYALQIFGVNFKIIENQHTKRQTLFSALSHALVGSQAKIFIEEIHTDVVNHITSDEQWNRYKENEEIKCLIEGCVVEKRKTKSGLGNQANSSSTIYNNNDSSKTNSEQDWRYLYRNHSFSSKNKGDMVELLAAAEKFHFTFGVMVLENPVEGKVGESNSNLKGIGKIHVYNCDSPEILHNSNGLKYYFLQSGEAKENWEWNYMQPFGDLYEIPDGIYPARFKRVLQYPKNIHHRHQYQNLPTPSNLIHQISLHSPIVFHSRSGTEFLYRKYEHDDKTLFSILNHALFDEKNEMRMEIQMLISARRQELHHVIRLYPERNTTIPRIRSTRNQNLLAYRYFVTGDLIDLRLASSIFGFTYECFGLDKNCNWFHLDSKTNQYDNKSEIRYARKDVHLILLVTGNDRDSVMKWYRLEPSPLILFWKQADLESGEESTDYEAKNTSDFESSEMSQPEDIRQSSYASAEKETGDSKFSHMETSESNTESSAEEDSESSTDYEEMLPSKSETETGNETSSASATGPEHSIPHLSLFRSIPIVPSSFLKQELQNRKMSSLRRMLTHLKSLLFPTTSKTKIMLIPKDPNNVNKISVLDSKSTNMIQGNIPWFASIPDLYMVTVDKSRPSTYLPVIAYERAKHRKGNKAFWFGSLHLGYSDEEDESDSLEHSESKLSVSRQKMTNAKVEGEVVEISEPKTKGFDSSSTYPRRFFRLPSWNDFVGMSSAMLSRIRRLFRFLRNRGNQQLPRFEAPGKDGEDDDPATLA